MQRAQDIDFEVGKTMLKKHKDDFITVRITGLPNPNLPPPRDKHVKFVYRPPGNVEEDSEETTAHMSQFYLVPDGMGDEYMDGGRTRRARKTRRRKTAHKKRKTLSKRK
jgi:hypothetical protein